MEQTASPPIRPNVTSRFLTLSSSNSSNKLCKTVNICVVCNEIIYTFLAYIALRTVTQGLELFRFLICPLIDTRYF